MLNECIWVGQWSFCVYLSTTNCMHIKINVWHVIKFELSRSKREGISGWRGVRYIKCIYFVEHIAAAHIRKKCSEQFHFDSFFPGYNVLNYGGVSRNNIASNRICTSESHKFWYRCSKFTYLIKMAKHSLTKCTKVLDISRNKKQYSFFFYLHTIKNNVNQHILAIQ